MPNKRPNAIHIIRNVLLGLTPKADMQIKMLMGVWGVTESEAIRRCIDEANQRAVESRFSEHSKQT